MMNSRPGFLGTSSCSGGLADVPCLAGVIIILFFLSLPVHAAAPLTVTVTADPATVAPGGTIPVTVLATYERVIITADTGSTVTTPLFGATVTLSSPAPGISFSPVSGTTDSGGRFSSALLASAQAAGNIAVYASVQDSRYSGSGLVTVIILESPAPQSGQQASLQPPAAVILVDRNAGYAPLAVQFDGRQSSDPDGSISDYRWSYGDGTSGTGYVSSHVYEQPGLYTATLVVTDNDGLVSFPASAGITVPGSSAPAGPAEPVAIIEVNRSFGPAPLAVAFDGSKSVSGSGNSGGLQWDFGDGTRSFDPVVTHVFPGQGAYEVMLTVTGNGGLSTAYSTIRIIAQPPTPSPGMTLVPRTPDPTARPGSTGSPPATVPAGPGEQSGNSSPAPWAVLPPSLAPLAGIITGILIGAAAAAMGRTRPDNFGERKMYEFIKVISGRKGVGVLALWEKSKIRSVVSHRSEVFFGLSVAEILVALTSAILVGGAFYLMYPDPGHILDVLVRFSAVAGVSVVVHDLARRQVSRRYGRYTEYQIWLLGTVVMFLTAWLFTCPCGKPSRPVSEEAAPDARQRASECLAGPAASVILACLFAGVIVAGGPGKTIAAVGVSINLLLAVYALMPFEPMEGRKVWAWNRPAYLLIIIPLLVSYLAVAYLLT
jgi:PKD repeat protein/Zn-dependent protease